MISEYLFIINLVCSIFMVGLIWFVQLVHYPSFRFVDDGFAAFHNHHTFKTGIIVMPVMVVEVTTSGWLWSLSNSWLTVNSIGFYAVIAIWVTTAVFHLPLHNALNKAKDEAAINKLVATNWIRTVLWTLKVGLGMWILLSL